MRFLGCRWQCVELEQLRRAYHFTSKQRSFFFCCLFDLIYSVIINLIFITVTYCHVIISMLSLCVCRIRKGGHHGDPCTSTVIDLLCKVTGDVLVPRSNGGVTVGRAGSLGVTSVAVLGLVCNSEVSFLCHFMTVHARPLLRPFLRDGRQCSVCHHTNLL